MRIDAKKRFNRALRCLTFALVSFAFLVQDFSPSLAALQVRVDQIVRRGDRGGVGRQRHETGSRTSRSAYSRRSRAAVMLHAYRRDAASAFMPITAAAAGSASSRAIGAA